MGLMAQDNQYTASKDSDPEAKAILDQVRKKYDTYTAMEADFKLEIEFPEQAKEVQEGHLSRKGTQYHLTLGQQEVLSDGKALYMILHNNQEVQINELPDPSEEGLLSPESIFSFYDQGDYIYSLTDTRTEGRQVIQAIEFKPVDRSSEYSKIRLVINKKTKDVVRVKAFGKDGSRYTFLLGKVQSQATFAANHFQFSKERYPGYYVEDLR